jgi:hypothetical protein
MSSHTRYVKQIPALLRKQLCFVFFFWSDVFFVIVVPFLALIYYDPVGGLKIYC